MRELEILVTADIQQAINALKQAQKTMDELATSAGTAGKKTDEIGNESSKAAKKTGIFASATDALTQQVMRYASYAAIGAAIHQSIQFGDAVSELSDKTGLSAEMLQRFGFVAEASGSSMDALANAVVFFNKNLQENSKKTQYELAQLGLTTEQLMRLPIDARFEVVAKAIGNLEDPGRLAEASMTLLNRSGKELIPTLKGIADGAADTVPILEDRYIKALADTSDAMDFLKRAAVVTIGTLIGGFGDAIRKDSIEIERMRLSMQGLSEDMIEAKLMADALKANGALEPPKQFQPPSMTPDFDAMAKALDEQGKKLNVANDEAIAYERSLNELVKQLSGAGAIEQVRLLNAAFLSLSPAQRDNVQVAERVLEQYNKLRDVVGTGAAPALEKLYVTLGPLTAGFKALLAEITVLESKNLSLTDIFEFDTQPVDNATAALMNFQMSVRSFSASSSKVWAPFAQTVERDTERFKNSFSNLSASFQNMGPTIVGALQGGGNAFAAVGSSLLGGLGADLGKQIATRVGGEFGKTLGGFAGPLGSVVGGLAGTLIGKLFGPSQQAQVRQMRDKFLETAGGLDAMRERANAAGVSMDRLMNARNTNEFQRAMDEFNAALQRAEKHAAAVREHIDKFNNALGTLLNEGSEIGIILPDALQETIDKLIEAKQITGENADLLRSFGQGGENNFKAMENAAKKYGVEISALGPAFQQNKLDKTAGEIIDAFNVMTKGGADVTAVITGMSDEINKFVQEAVKSGRTVPENMRPILDKMLEQGQLTDENGQKLKDLSSIQFGAPIETAMDRLIKKIEELIDKFSKEMPKAFDGAASAGERFAERVAGAVEGIPDRLTFNTDTPGFDRGGVVGRDYLPPTSRDVIPALLRPGEVVLTPEQLAAGARTSPTSVSVTINVAGYLDSPTARTGLADIVRDEISKNLRRIGRAA